MQQYIFIHKRLGYKFAVEALNFYHAVDLLQSILGAEKYWIADYICLSDGYEVGYKVA